MSLSCPTCIEDIGNLTNGGKASFSFQKIPRSCNSYAGQCRCCGFVVLKHQSRSESVLITFKQNIVGENSVNRLLASSESWIHFSRGGELSLDDKSLFTKFSPNVIRTLTGSLNVIGASAQQNHNISTDLGAHSISFERMDCEIIFVDRSKYNVHRSH
ncbi:hypothetical protein Bca4012_054311 [Brassica carinata]